MADFEIDLSGVAELQDTIDDIKGDWGDSPTFEVGTNAEYAVHLEFGRGPIRASGDGYLRFEVDGEVIFRKEVSGHPPYPFFRPAIREFKANPITFITENTGFSSTEEIPNVNMLVRSVANALSNKMKDNASANSASDRSPGTDSDHPVRQSGNLVGSISFERIG